MSARKDYPYPEDEFDVAGSAGGPEGVHRAERSTARKVAPWIVVLLVVPLIAFGIVFYLSQNDADMGGLFNDDEPAPTQPTDDADSPEPDAGEGTAGEGEGEEEEPDADEAEEEPDAEPPAPVDREVRVQVLNATGISGLAGVSSETLQADGFSSVAPDNYRGGGTRAKSVVKYTHEELKPTAEQVAQVLGIDDVVEDPEPGDSIIVEIWEDLN